MATRTRFISIVIAPLVIIWSSYASAGIVTINFPADLASPCTFVCLNTTADGFRISPQHHYDTIVLTSTIPTSLPGIGWDASGGVNPDYLGPVMPFHSGLYIDHNGLPFGLLSLESLASIIGGSSVIAESSKGATAVIPPTPTPPLHVDFVGEGWSDIQWVTFFNEAPGAPITGFAQLVTFVPGPPTLGLFGLGVLILGWRSCFSKRRRSSAQ